MFYFRGRVIFFTLAFIVGINGALQAEQLHDSRSSERTLSADFIGNASCIGARGDNSPFLSIAVMIERIVSSHKVYTNVTGSSALMQADYGHVPYGFWEGEVLNQTCPTSFDVRVILAKPAEVRTATCTYELNSNNVTTYKCLNHLTYN